MRIALIGCMVMNREISRLVADSRHIVRVWWLRQGLHNTPDVLRSELQRAIDNIEAENKKEGERNREHLRYEAIVLGYGLCSNGVIGLRSRSLPIVVPRCDDCISLFLGSADKYRRLFRQMPGTFWYNPGWIEQADMPCKERDQRQLEEYIEQYGEENAEFLMECSNEWMVKYEHCGYITCPWGEDPQFEQFARQAAKDYNWEFNKVEGEKGYLDALVNGPWDDQRFLTCPPNSRIEPDYSNRKFRSVPCEIEDFSAEELQKNAEQRVQDAEGKTQLKNIGLW